jgi:hypothetical protein
MKTNGATVRETQRRLEQLGQDKAALAVEMRTARTKLDRLNKLIVNERRFLQAHEQGG